MDDKGEIVSSHDVDDNLSLQIWTKGHTPRLVIFNKAKNSKKLIRLGWRSGTASWPSAERSAARA